MKEFAIQAIVLVLVIIGALAYQTGKLPIFPATPGFLKPVETTKQTEVLIKGVVIKAEVADTAEKRAKGLGGRQGLASDSGMLFIFDNSQIHVFWMKGLSFSLDLIWIKDKKVVDITKNAAPTDPKTPDSELPRYQTNQQTDMVLEVNGGFVDANGIVIGDTVLITNKQSLRPNGLNQ